MVSSAEPIVNDFEPSAQIVLKDGKVRVFRFGFHEAYLFEKSMGMSFVQALGRPDSLEKIRLLVFAGLHQDAATARESWTPEKVAGLMPIRVDQLKEISDKMRMVIDAALIGPAEEGKDSASLHGTAPAKATRGRGRKPSSSRSAG
jgi:hypothetical protein